MSACVAVLFGGSLTPHLTTNAVAVYAVESTEDTPISVEITPEPRKNYWFSFFDDPITGEDYKNALIRAIQGSDRIVVTERSDNNDFADAERRWKTGKKDVIYDEKTLDAKQKEHLLMIIQGMDSTLPHPGFGNGCLPRYHHMMEFYSGEKLTSTMKICVQCKMIHWNGTKGRTPTALHKHMEEFIKDVGLTPSRDWFALAKANSSK